MITERVIDLWAAFIAWCVALLPESDTSLPAQVLAFDSTVNDLLQMTAGLGSWIDWGYAVICVGVVLAVWLLGFGIRFVRWVISFVPTMSGGT